MSQEELAFALGTTKSTISKYELGRRQPRIEHLSSIAAALQLNLMELLDGLDENGNDAIQRGVLDILDKEVAEEKKSHIATITALFTQLNGHGREKVISYAEGLADSPDYRADFGGD